MRVVIRSQQGARGRIPDPPGHVRCPTGWRRSGGACPPRAGVGPAPGSVAMRPTPRRHGRQDGRGGELGGATVGRRGSMGRLLLPSVGTSIWIGGRGPRLALGVMLRRHVLNVSACSSGWHHPHVIGLVPPVMSAISCFCRPRPAPRVQRSAQSRSSLWSGMGRAQVYRRSGIQDAHARPWLATNWGVTINSVGEVGA